MAPPLSKSKTANPRKRLTENASHSRIAESNDIWHSTAIEDVESGLNNFEGLLPIQETPIRGKKPKKITTVTKTKDPGTSVRDSGRGGSTTRDSGDEQPARPVVINPPSGHSFFSGVLQKCGYIIRQPTTNNEMFKNVMKFRKTMADWLVANENEMSRVETETSKFLKALNAYLSEKDNFISSMKPTRHETELIQPSMLHCLLGIEALQLQVLKRVFSVLSESAFSSQEDEIALVSTLLNQLKWLPSLVDGQKFVDTLLSIVDTASTPCQSLIIKFLPDMVPSNLHVKAAEKLLEKFSESRQQLNIALLDCFSSLDIPDGYWSNVKTSAIEQMATASFQDIPAYFSFLFREEASDQLYQVITEVREKVKLVPEKNNHKMDAFQVEILEKIGFCITVNPGIEKLWIKQIKDDLQDNLSENIKKIDLLMLFLFAESSKPAINTLKLLFAEKQIALKLFKDLMKNNLAMIYHLFATISKFLDSLLRVSRDPKCLDTVCEMTINLFLGLSLVEAQTLMGNLTSILVNFPPSRDTVLQILTKLAEKEPRKLLHFASYLMGVLEYVMQFPAGQIRSLMNVLAILSQTDGRSPVGSNHFSAEFSILLRKQLTHSDLKIRCFGVYGALASVRRMAERNIPDDAKISELLRLAWNFVERDEDACSIFLDELSTCANSLPLDICRAHRDTLKNKFENLWTVDAADAQKIKQYGLRKNMNLVPIFDANRECTEERLLVNFENHPMSMSPLVVPAHLRALAILESKVETKNLVGIDAILGCPILFPSMQEYYERESITDLKYNQRCHLGQYLVLAINFFRESVCAFINDNDMELRVKVWLRLDNIIKLQKILVKHLDSFPSLPNAYVAEKTIGGSKDGAGPSGLQAFRMAKDEKVGKDKPKKSPPMKKSSKKKAKTDDANSGSEDEESVSAPAAQKKVKVCLDEEIQPKRICSYLRRFDQSVFAILRNPLRADEEEVDFSHILLDISSVTQSDAVIKKVEKFSPDSLVLLLVELKRQVSGQQSSMNILSVKKLLKYVCAHVNQIHSVLLKNEENDMADVTESSTKLECCLRLLIDILTSYFEAISKLDKEEKAEAIKKSICILSQQGLTRNDDEVLQSQAEVMVNVANYLCGLVSVIKDSSTALDHLKLLKNLHDLLDGHAEFKKAIDNATKVYLSCEWKLPSAKVDGFLKIWLGTAHNPMKVIKHLAEKLLSKDDEDDEEGDFDFNKTIYKSCTITNFHTWYSAMMSGLSQFVYKNLRRRGDYEDSIAAWKDAVVVWLNLVSVAKKEFKQKSLKNFILIALLRHSRQFLEAFISGGAELLPKYWEEDRAEAQKFCKSLQVPCRIVQHICEHSKIHSELLLLKSVPLVKRALETLVFRVREVLGVHGAANAFWMGSLKHRDLRGETIPSQIANGEWDSDEDGSENDDETDDVQAAPLSGVTEVSDVNEDSVDADDVDMEVEDGD